MIYTTQELLTMAARLDVWSQGIDPQTGCIQLHDDIIGELSLMLRESAKEIQALGVARENTGGHMTVASLMAHLSIMPPNAKVYCGEDITGQDAVYISGVTDTGSGRIEIW